jgi:GntR family transcriptional regulator, transcriptional repressor for pyruvate dehydrogenase complex
MPSAMTRGSPSPPVSERVFRTLSEAVLSGRYGPGEKLPTQRDLAADLGVTMTAIREALKRLEQLRLIEVRHGDAMRVTNWRAEGGLDVIAHVLLRGGTVDRGTLAAIVEARCSMLSEVARLAAARRSDAHAIALLDLADRISVAEGAEEAQALDFAFFQEMVEAADNVVYVLVMNSIRQLYFEQAALFRAVVANHTELAPLYRRAALAVKRGDGARSAGCVRRLAEAQGRRLEAALR